MQENDISYTVRGPGLLESAYEAALAYELSNTGLIVKTQVMATNE